MPDGIPRVRGPAIAREISQIRAPESPARRGGAGVLEALRETFALSPAARELKIRGIAAKRQRRALEEERQLPAGGVEAAALGLLFQGALAAQGASGEEASMQAREATEGLTRGQVQNVTTILGQLIRRNPQGADQALTRSLTLRGQLAQQLSRLDDDIRALEQIGIAGEPFTAGQTARRDQLVKERAALKTSLDSFDRLINGLFGIGGQRAAPPAARSTQVQQPARRDTAQAARPAGGEPPAPADVKTAEEEFLRGL